MDSFMKLKSDFEGLIGKIKIPGADGQVSDEIFYYYLTGKKREMASIIVELMILIEANVRKR